jgi:hypothetical protein
VDRGPLGKLASSFNPLYGVQYDPMHTVSGVMKDSVVGSLKGWRLYEPGLEYDRHENKRWLNKETPWVLTDHDLVEVKQALQVI